MKILVAFGANIPGTAGSPEQTFQQVISELKVSGFEVAGVSSLYRSKPLGNLDLPDFTNACILLESCGPGPEQLLKLFKDMEKKAGRKEKQFWGSRPLDLDIIDFGGLVKDFPDCYLKRRADRLVNSKTACVRKSLVLPHPEVHWRNFVLAPILEIHRFWHHPVTGLTANEHLRKLEVVGQSPQLLIYPTRLP